MSAMSAVASPISAVAYVGSSARPPVAVFRQARQPPTRPPAACRRALPVRCDAATGSKPDLIQLGQSSLKVSPIGVGTLQWGDPSSGFPDRYNEQTLREAFEALVEGGVNFFDSAEVYGYQNIKNGQSSEQLLGRFAREHNTPNSNPPLVLTSKFFTVPWTNLLVGGRRFAIGKEVAHRCIHFPLPTFPNGVAADALREALDLGLTKAVGVSNYNVSQLEDIVGKLSSKGVQLASNQVNYSLLNREPEKSGLLQACKLRQLLKLMDFIGALNGGRSTVQVALNYIVAKGAVPIAGCKNAKQAADIASALSWSLDENSAAILDEKLEALGL
eukprot:jgi/Chlat1/7159/Chrsp57S06744